MNNVKSYVVIGAFALECLTLAGLAFARGAPPGPRRHLPPPDYLDEAGRAALSLQMRNHPDEMARLTTAVTLLDHTGAEAIAEWLLEEPMLPRSTSPTDPLRNLPQRLRDFDEQFHDQAKKLAKAAKSGDDAAVAARYGELTQTCVACHHAYLHPSPPPPVQK
jgi:hypothetical protein